LPDVAYNGTVIVPENAPVLSDAIEDTVTSDVVSNDTVIIDDGAKPVPDTVTVVPT